MKIKYLLLFIAVSYITRFQLHGQNIKTDTLKNILIVMAHPDDWECCMGGTALLLKDRYHINVLIATKGERGLSKAPSTETARIREKEAMNACEKVHASLYFLNKIDGDVYADKEGVDKIVNLLKKLDPVMVFTRWGIDVPDHAAVSNMTLKALWITGMIHDREIYFTEAQRGGQSNQFEPNLYVNISSVIEQKEELIRCHISQNKEDNLLNIHMVQDKMNGLVGRCDYAEVFKTYYPPINSRWSKKMKYSLLDLL
jgi:LmbE family N-acetylglucosaminyl deacetylase